MKKIIVFMSAIFVATNFFAQSLSPELISTSGDFHSNGTVSLSWSIGEVMTETYIGENNSITQGFHYGKLTFVGINENNNLDFSIDVFPNPTNDFINIIFSENFEENINLQVHDITGKLLVSKKLFKENSVDFTSYPLGTYFISFINSDNQIIKTGKIIKSK